MGRGRNNVKRRGEGSKECKDGGERGRGGTSITVNVSLLNSYLLAKFIKTLFSSKTLVRILH